MSIEQQPGTPPTATPEPVPAAGAPGTPPPYGPPGVPAPQQMRGTSGLVITGFVLAFLIAPVGFILSIIGTATSGVKHGRKGRGLAIAGIVVSVLVMAGGIAAVAAAANSTVLDPGCVDGKSAIIDNSDQIATGDPAKVRAGLQTTIDGLDAAIKEAKHDNVKDAMTAVRGDYAQLLQAVNSGTQPDPSLQDKLNADAAQVDNLCTIGS